MTREYHEKQGLRVTFVKQSLWQGRGDYLNQGVLLGRVRSGFPAGYPWLIVTIPEGSMRREYEIATRSILLPGTSKVHFVPLNLVPGLL